MTERKNKTASEIADDFDPQDDLAFMHKTRLFDARGLYEDGTLEEYPTDSVGLREVKGWEHEGLEEIHAEVNEALTTSPEYTEEVKSLRKMLKLLRRI